MQTIEGVTFFSRALHSGTEENDLLVQMIKESGKELSKEFIEGDADKKARMLGQAVGEVLLALVSTKGVTAAVDAIKAGIKSGELASWFSKFSKGTATAEDIANGLGKTAEAVDKADDSVKIIGNIEGAGETVDNLLPSGATREGLEEVASAPAKGGVTPIGRAFQKHAGDAQRAGTFTGEVSGNAAKNTEQGMNYLNQILDNPDSTVVVRNTKAYGEVIDIRTPDGTGVRFSADGKTFIGFLEKYTPNK